MFELNVLKYKDYNTLFANRNNNGISYVGMFASIFQYINEILIEKIYRFSY